MASSPPDVKPFRIAVPKEKLDHLAAKLKLARFPAQVHAPNGDNFAFGAPVDKVQKLVTAWRDSYDWRKHEKELNETLPQFTTGVQVDGFGELETHFVWKRSGRVGAVPLVFIHGWPGSFIEVKKVLPLLTSATGDDVVFDVVAPSLTGYAWSEAPRTKGFGLKQHAEQIHKLMLKLGYSEYVTQGGDWGSMISRVMGLHYPDSVKASHLNFFPIFPSMRIPLQHPLIFLSTVYKAFFDADTKACLKHWQHVSEEETAYLQIQSTKPITLGYGLTDSPVALLGWIYEKLCSWTDAYPWTDDEVLTWISIYEFSRAGPAASVQIYYEAKHPEPSEGPGKGVSMKDILTTYVPRVPIGLSHFPKEIMPLPFGMGGVCGRVVQEVKHESGGHFAAWEKPEELVGDVKKMFGKGGPCYGIVPGKNGVGTGEARKDL